MNRRQDVVGDFMDDIGRSGLPSFTNKYRLNLVSST